MARGTTQHAREEIRVGVGMSAVTPRTRFVKASGRARFASALGVTLALVVSGCSAEPDVQLTGCSELIPQETVGDVLGNRNGQLVQLRDLQVDPVSPLVDEMVTDGIACGGSVNGAVTLDGAVLVGQLSVGEERWTEIQVEFAADGHVAVDDTSGVPGWVHVAHPDDDPSMGTGFAWEDGVLFYAINPLLYVFATS